jgi:predicted restriction endonuclease
MLNYSNFSSSSKFNKVQTDKYGRSLFYMSSIDKYIYKFNNLNRGSTPFGKAPHKPILLITLLELVDKGYILNNRVYVDPELVGTFQENWRLLVNTLHQPDFTQPFYYIQSEKVNGTPLWRLIPKPGCQINSLIKSVNTLISVLDYGCFSPDLFQFLNDPINRSLILMNLLNTYFQETKVNYLESKRTGRGYLNDLEGFILNEPEVEYKTIKIETEEDVFVRGGLFKKLVPKVYNNTCCITGMRLESTFGQGSKPYTLETIGHEVSHGILRYHEMNSPPANCDFGFIDESIADLFGILAKNYYLKQKNMNASYDWTYRMKFNNPLYDASSTNAIKTAGFPTAYKGTNYGQYCSDPHLNRTLLPYWFYLLSTGGSNHIDENSEKPLFQVTGIGVNHAEKILWRTITEFLSAYNTNSMSFLDFRQAAKKAAIAEYGANSPELQSVCDAFFAVNIRLPSIPEDNAHNINPWPAVFEKTIEYPDNENQWAIDISEDKTFPENNPSKTYTKILTKATDTKIVNGKLCIVTSANLQPKNTYYWRVRTIGYEQNGSGQSFAFAESQTQPNAGQDIRSFTTDERLVTANHIENPYPWGIQLTWNTMLNVPGSEIQNYIVNIFHQNDQYPFIERSLPASADPTQSTPADKPDYIVLQAGSNYEWTIYAQGHDDVFGKKSFGSSNAQDNFKTSVPFTTLTFPTDNIIINPFSNTTQSLFPLFDLAWQRTLNAGKYRVQISKNKNIQNPVLNTEDNTGEYNTIKSFNPGPSSDGNNKYYWQITPLASALTNQSVNDPEIPNPGITTTPFSFTYNYKITKPQLIAFLAVNLLQQKISFKWKKVPGASYYKITIAERGLLGLANHISIDVMDNGSNEYEKIVDGDKPYPLDLASFPNGYEWQVQAFKTSGSKDLPGEAAKSSYDIMRGKSEITSPGDNEVLPVTAVQNSEIHYAW